MVKKIIYGLVFVLFVFIAVVLGWNIMYKTKSSPKGIPESIKFNANGTMSVVNNIKEYFAFIENERGTKYTHDDPIHVRYYTNKDTRDSVWNGLNNTSSDMANTPCDAPDCEFVNTTDREATVTLLNDLVVSMKPDLFDYRKYLKSKGIEKVGSYVKKVQAHQGDFVFDILFKGYAIYKGVTVPKQWTAANYRSSEYYKRIVKQVPILQKVHMIHEIMMGKFSTKIKNDGTKAMYIDPRPPRQRDGTGGVEVAMGIEYPLFASVLIVAMIQIILENKDIGDVLYEPPTVMLSYKQINENLNTKMATLHT